MHPTHYRWGLSGCEPPSERLLPKLLLSRPATLSITFINIVSWWRRRHEQSIFRQTGVCLALLAAAAATSVHMNAIRVSHSQNENRVKAASVSLLYDGQGKIENKQKWYVCGAWTLASISLQLLLLLLLASYTGHMHEIVVIRAAADRICFATTL